MNKVHESDYGCRVYAEVAERTKPEEKVSACRFFNIIVIHLSLSRHLNTAMLL